MSEIHFDVFARKLTWYFIGVYIIKNKLFYLKEMETHEVSNSVEPSSQARRLEKLSLSCPSPRVILFCIQKAKEWGRDKSSPIETINPGYFF